MRPQGKSSGLTWLTLLSLFVSLLAGGTFSGPASARNGKGAARQVSRTPTSGGEETALEALPKFARNLTEAARQRYFIPSAEHEAAVRRTLRVLSQTGGNNPILLDETGIARSVVVEGVALKLAAGEAPR
ncbi:MAG: hypothetical protein M3416_02630, partial [Acidobacteriota bacterium]|nr:hypothetical protein [Acidobacteriota bacterium]